MSEQSQDNSKIFADKEQGSLSPDLEAALREAQAHADELEDKKTKGAGKAHEGVSDEVLMGEVLMGEVIEDHQPAGEGEQNDQDGGAELEQMRAEIEQAQKQVTEMKDAMLRARADLENARRRFEREKKEDQLFAGERVLKALIPVVDDLDRALDNVPEEEDHSGSLVEGVQMVHRKFLQALESQGAKSFYPQGELFDPTTHEALMEMPSEDVEAGHIAQVFQRGWLLNERLLRPAKVIIAKAP